jgi:hypothetical protein
VIIDSCYKKIVRKKERKNVYVSSSAMQHVIIITAHWIIAQLRDQKIFRRCTYCTSFWGVRAPHLRIYDLCAVYGSFLVKTKGGRA